MDEPFAALDEMSRDRLNEELLRLRGELKWTVLFVTHSVAEAVYLSDRIIVLAPNPGRVAHEITIDLPSPRDAELRSSAAMDECIAVVSTGVKGSAQSVKKHAMIALNACIVLASLLLFWQLLVWALSIPKYMLPTPWAVARTVVQRYDSLLTSIWITGEAAAGGLLASIAVGVVIALIFAQSRWIRAHVLPLHAAAADGPHPGHCSADPDVDGPRHLSVMCVAFIICLAPIIANTTQGLISVDQNLINLFLMHNAIQPR